MERMVGFAAVSTDITWRGVLSEEASIHKAKMTTIKVALKEIHKKEDKRWIIYTDTQSSMQSIKYNKENPPILNPRYMIF